MTNCTHQEGGGAQNSRRLLLALGVIVVFLVVEVVGGILSGSLALLADATHMLTDALALGLAASAQVFAMRPADSSLHFGYRRAQVLAAFVNGILLAVLLVWIMIEAIARFLSPIAVDAPLMLWVAAAGLVANIVAFLILHRGQDDLNVRGAMLHVIGDLLGSVAAITAAIVITMTGWVRIDPLLSVLVAILIGVSAIRLIKETGFILLEGAPDNIDSTALADGLKAMSPVIKDVHHVRIWQITPDQPRIMLHACVDRADDAASALQTAKEYLAAEFNIHHSTIQIDVGGHCPDNPNMAETPAKTQPSPANPAERQAAESAVAAHQH